MLYCFPTNQPWKDSQRNYFKAKSSTKLSSLNLTVPVACLTSRPISLCSITPINAKWQKRGLQGTCERKRCGIWGTFRWWMPFHKCKLGTCTASCLIFKRTLWNCQSSCFHLFFTTEEVSWLFLFRRAVSFFHRKSSWPALLRSFWVSLCILPAKVAAVLFPPISLVRDSTFPLSTLSWVLRWSPLSHLSSGGTRYNAWCFVVMVSLGHLAARWLLKSKGRWVLLGWPVHGNGCGVLDVSIGARSVESIRGSDAVHSKGNWSPINRDVRRESGALWWSQAVFVWWGYEERWQELSLNPSE